MQNTMRIPAGKTRLAKLFLACPVSASIGFGFVFLGVATGISTSSLLACTGIIGCAGKGEISWLLPFFHIAALELLLACSVLSAVYHRAAWPFACAAFAVKGMVSGFAVRQLFAEFEFRTAFPCAAGVLLFALPAYTALFTAFAGCAAVRKMQKEEEKTKRKTAYAFTAAALFLALLGAVSEGMVYPALVRTFFGDAL